MALAGCGWVHKEEAEINSDLEAREEIPRTGLDYSVDLHGTIPGGMRATMEQVIAANPRDIPPPNESFLEKRMQELSKQLGKVLNANGYYNGSIDINYTRDTNDVPVVNFVVDPGPQTKIVSFQIDYTPPEGTADLAQSGKDLGLSPDQPALSQRIIDLTDESVRRLNNTGYPFAKLKDRKVVVDIARQTADITLYIEQGPKVDFGEVTFGGLTKTKEVFADRQLTFKPGDTFDQSELNASLENLRELGLFNLVAPTLGTPENGRVPISIEVQERDHRTIGAGVKWSTDNGFGGQAYWEHRDIFGAGEKLRFALDAEQISQSVTVGFSKPQFRVRNQDLVAGFSASNEDTDAYNEQSITTSVGIERRLSKILKGGIGLSFQLLRSDDYEGTTGYQLFGVPTNLKLDSTNDLFDPNKGFRGTLRVTPYTGLGGGQPVNFVRLDAILARYDAIIGKNTLIWANRARFGSDLSAGDATLPGSLRFYAGGGGSVRGYAYQEIGPLAPDGSPEGGLSVTEIGTELRYRPFESIGFVTFFEGANVYETTLPNFSGGYFWGTGFGFRYYTPIGPVRADIGFPLRKRSGIDDPFQIYLSIGQAF